MTTNRFFLALSALSLTFLWPTVIRAQDYPNRTIRYIVPSSAGGGADLIGRILAKGLTDILGQQVIVDNRAGASGNIAAELVVQAAPDGYTVLQANIIHAANVNLFRKLNYDVQKDFAPVIHLASSPAMIIVHPSLPVKSVKDLIALARQQPMAINFSTAGPGSSSFLAAAVFMSAAGVKMLQVPYRGGGAAMSGIVTGETSVMFAPIGSSMPHIRSGKLRPIAVTTKERYPSVPDYPTIAESGVPGYEFNSWYGLAVPARTPAAVIAALNTAAMSVIRNAATSERMNSVGFVPIGGTPEDFSRHMSAQISLLRKVIRETGVKPQ